jgi:DNA topoisomerase-3
MPGHRLTKTYNVKGREMMNLYICEKKTVGKALSDVLPGTKKREENFIRCGSDIVAWASGHLLELCEPENYDPVYKQWNRGTLLYGYCTVGRT